MTFSEMRKSDEWHMRYGGKGSYMEPGARMKMRNDEERIKRLHRADGGKGYCRREARSRFCDEKIRIVIRSAKDCIRLIVSCWINFIHPN